MRVTKHEHACLRLDSEGKTLLIDPGSFTLPLDDLNGLVGVILTHEHPDHWTPAQLDAVLSQAPGVPIFGPAGVVAAASDYDVTAVEVGDELELGPFRLRFFGGTHSVIHESIPVIDNLGVLVNDDFYYPGDSYAVPEGVEVGLLTDDAALTAALHRAPVAPLNTQPAMDAIDKRLRNLKLLALDGVIPPAEYRETRQELEAQKAALQQAGTTLQLSPAPDLTRARTLLAEALAQPDLLSVVRALDLHATVYPEGRVDLRLDGI